MRVDVCDLLFVLLVGLKIAEIGNYSWWVAFAPVIIKLVALLIAGFIYAIAKAGSKS